MHSDCDGVQFPDCMSEQALVFGHARVTLNEALSQVVDEQTKRVVGRLKPLHTQMNVKLDGVLLAVGN